MYKQFQNGLHVRAREDFLDLLVEQTDLFVKAVRRYLGQLDESSGSVSLTELSNCGQAETQCCRLAPELYHPFATHSHSFSVSTNNCSAAGCLHKIRWLSAPPRGAKEMQLSWLNNQLICDKRYQTMTFLPSERQTLITSYFDILLPSRIQWPSSNCSLIRTSNIDSKGKYIFQGV